MSTIPLKCQCGSVEGTATNIKQSSGNRVVCCCRDCQDFAKFLDSETQTLDSSGGTEIYQTSQSQIKIHKGQTNLKSMKLSSKGLIRWYSSCCNTPIGNSMKGASPFFGIIHTFIDVENRDEAFGEILAYCQTQDASSDVKHPKAHPKFPLGLTLRLLRQLLVWKVQGKHKPSAFFTENGDPVTEPLVVN